MTIPRDSFLRRNCSPLSIRRTGRIFSGFREMPRQVLLDHPPADRGIRKWIHQDEAPGKAAESVGIEE